MGRVHKEATTNSKNEIDSQQMDNVKTDASRYPFCFCICNFGTRWPEVKRFQYLSNDFLQLPKTLLEKG